MASTEIAVPLNNQHEIVRQLADFPENIWAHRIASFTLDKQVILPLILSFGELKLHAYVLNRTSKDDLCGTFVWQTFSLSHLIPHPL